MVYSAVLAARTVIGSIPKPPPMLADMSAGTRIKKAWPLYGQQVSHKRWISGFHCTHATKHTSEGSTLALKPRGDTTRSPTEGYQWPHEKDLCSPKIFLKKVERTRHQECRIKILPTNPLHASSTALTLWCKFSVYREKCISYTIRFHSGASRNRNNSVTRYPVGCDTVFHCNLWKYVDSILPDR